MTCGLVSIQGGDFVQVKIPNKDKHETAKGWSRPLNRGGRLIQVQSTESVWARNRFFENRPLKRWWPLNVFDDIRHLFIKYIPREVSKHMVIMATRKMPRDSRVTMSSHTLKLNTKAHTEENSVLHIVSRVVRLWRNPKTNHVIS